MPTRPLTQNDNLETISKWLDENLNDEMFISDSNLTDKKDLRNKMKPYAKEKGLYFWFIHPDGYKELSRKNIIKIEPNGNEYSKEINGLRYHLVYLGTAGVRNNENGNRSTLLDRLNWHLFNAQTEKSVISGHMSTLRRTLGSLISDDLIEFATQIKLTELIKSYFSVFFLTYGSETSGDVFEAIQKKVSTDETHLIKNVKPILNLSQNPNEKIPGHVTNTISARRKKVEIDTKERLAQKISNAELTSKKGNQKKISKSENIIIEDGLGNYNDRLKQKEDGCFVFHVKKNESIYEVVKGIKGLPTGYCKIEIWDFNNPLNKFTSWKRETGKNVNGQNIYNYFSANCTENIPRWKFISFWMSENNIDKIVVLICPKN
jgi:hypothetical protein